MTAPAWSSGPGRPSLRAQGAIANGAVLLLLAAWFVASARGASQLVIPDPARVLPLALQLFVDPQYATHTYTSLGRVLVSCAIALVAGVGLMLAARFVYQTRILVAHRLFPLLNAFPSVGWAILAIFWFGVGDVAVVFVNVAILLPFFMANMWSGLLNLDEEIYEMARSFSRDRARRLRLVVLPLLFPYLVAALRVAYGVGWKVGIVAEVFGVATGLGYLMNYARTVFDTPLLYASILDIVVLVFVVDRLVLERLERYTTRHRAESFARVTAPTGLVA